MSFDKNNKYYLFFMNQAGKRLDGDGIAVPDLGEIYHFRNGLRRGNGHLVFGRIRRRRGLGIGSFLLNLFNRAKPVLRAIGTKAVDVASSIAKDALSGEDIKTSAISNITAALPPTLKRFAGINTEETSSPPKRVSFGADKQRKKRKTRIKTGRGLESNSISSVYPGLQFLQ